MKLSEIVSTEQPTGQTEPTTKLRLSSIMAQEEPNQALNNLKGATIGIPALAGAGYGLYKSRIPQTIGGGISAIGKGVANLPKVVNTQKGTKFAEEVRQAFIEAHSQVVNKFGKDIDTLAIKYPNNSVNLSELVSDLQANPDISKQTLGILKRVPKLDNILENPKLASNINLRDTQDIVNYLQTKVPKNIRTNNFDLLDTINTIKGKQLEAFPELAGTRAEYAKFIEPYKNVKNYFRFNKLLDAIKNRFGGAEGEMAVKKILPPEVVKKLKGYRSGAKLAELPGDIPFLGRFFRSIGGALSVYPMASQAFEVWLNRNDPQAQINAMIGGAPLPPKGSWERDVRMGRGI
jgi:hypothetical protein